MRGYYVNKPIVKMFEKPGDSAVSDELLYGWKVEILDSGGDWCKVRTEYLYEGFIEKDDVTGAEYGFGSYVLNGATDILSEASYKSLVHLTVFAGSRVKIIGEQNGFYKTELLDKKWGYIKKEFADNINIGFKANIKDEAAFRERIIKTAARFTGVQYRWGGKTVMGIDCSGLAFMSYMLNGVYIFRDSKMPEGFPIKQIPAKKLKKGDLLFIPGHVMIYCGGSEDTKYFIHASMSNGEVKTDTVDVCDEDNFKVFDENALCGSLFVS